MNNIEDKNKFFGNVSYTNKNYNHTNGFYNGSILNKISFAQSKVLENGVKFGESHVNIKKSINYN